MERVAGSGTVGVVSVLFVKSLNSNCPANEEETVMSLMIQMLDWLAKVVFILPNDPTRMNARGGRSVQLLPVMPALSQTVSRRLVPGVPPKVLLMPVMLPPDTSYSSTRSGSGGAVPLKPPT